MFWLFAWRCAWLFAWFVRFEVGNWLIEKAAACPGIPLRSYMHARAIKNTCAVSHSHRQPEKLCAPHTQDDTPHDQPLSSYSRYICCPQCCPHTTTFARADTPAGWGRVCSPALTTRTRRRGVTLLSTYQPTIHVIVLLQVMQT